MASASTGIELHRHDARTSKGICVHVLSGRDLSLVQGVVVMTHGYSEHAGRYLELSQQIIIETHHTWAVVLYDVRGHGDSPGKKGFIADYDEYLRDLDDVIVLAGAMAKRIVLLGHSNGGLITLRWLTDPSRKDKRRSVQAAILSAPFLATATPLGLKDRLLTRLFGTIAPETEKPFDDGFELKLTHDVAIQNQHKIDPRCFRASTVGWFNQAMLAQELIKTFMNDKMQASSLGIMTFWLVPGQDSVCNADLMRKVAKKVGGTVFDYPDLYHEILLETNRSEIISRIVSEVLLPIASQTSRL